MNRPLMNARAKFCGQVTPGEGRLVLCMMAHEDKVSNKCD